MPAREKGKGPNAKQREGVMPMTEKERRHDANHGNSWGGGLMPTREKGRRPNAVGGSNISYHNHPWPVPIMYYVLHTPIMYMKINNKQRVSVEELIASCLAADIMRQIPL